jgi:hypothetical protein
MPAKLKYDNGILYGIPWISDQDSRKRKQLKQGKARGQGHFWKSGPTLGIPKSKEDFFIKTSIFQQYKI